MTLSEVAEDVRRNPHKYCGGATHIEARQVFGVVEAFEADPEFTLRSRIEALLADADAHININGTEFTLTSRLRALLKEGRT